MKRVIPIVSVFALLLSLAIVASAYGVQNVFFDGGFWTNTLEVNFYVGAPSSGEYNTKKSTVNQSYYIKQCWARIQEGSGDTGRVFSPVAKNPKKSGEGILKAIATKNNLLFYSCTNSWDWYYAQ